MCVLGVPCDRKYPGKLQKLSFTSSQLKHASFITENINSHSCQWSLGLIFQPQIAQWGAGGSLCDIKVPLVKPLHPNICYFYLRCRSKTGLQVISFSFPCVWRWNESPQKWTFVSVFQKSVYFQEFLPTQRLLGMCSMWIISQTKPIKEIWR